MPSIHAISASWERMVSKKPDLIDRLIERDRVSPRFSSFARGVTRFRRIGNFAFQPVVSRK